jgi:hypothetical protein
MGTLPINADLTRAQKFLQWAVAKRREMTPEPAIKAQTRLLGFHARTGEFYWR